MKGLALWIARIIPRGWSHILYWAARRYPELARYRVKLKLAPEMAFVADLNESVCLPLFKWGCYPHQIHEDTLIPSLLKEGEVVFDVGANIGYTAVLFSRAVGSKGHVYAFEPARRCATLLRENTAGATNVTVVEEGVSDRTGTLLFEEHATLDTSRIALDAGQSGGLQEGYAVPVVSLDGFVSSSGARVPQMIKVDVEGHEPAVFRGAAGLLRDTSPMLYFEALDAESLARCRSAIEEAAPGLYRHFQFTASGKLAPLSECAEKSVNNFLAMPAWGLARLAPFLEASLREPASALGDDNRGGGS